MYGIYLKADCQCLLGFPRMIFDLYIYKGAKNPCKQGNIEVFNLYNLFEVVSGIFLNML